MSNVKQLKHLEHIEDEMLNYGVAGCMAAVSFLQELLAMLGKKSESRGFMQTKWDGAPSVVCGTNPQNGMFFVGTKSVFAKTPKACYSDDDVDMYYEGDLAEKLKFSLKYFKQLGIRGIIQGDLLFTDSTLNTETIDGEKLYTFRPNTITYAIPVDHEMGKAAKQAKIGVVFHTHYTGDSFATMQARAGAPIHTFTKTRECLVISNDTAVNEVTLTDQEIKKFHDHIKKIERMCELCGDFLDNLVVNTGTTGDKKFHVASYLKQFFNNEIREGRVITNVRNTLDSLIIFYHEKMKKELGKIKTEKNLTAKRMLVYQSEEYLNVNERKFQAMLALYKEMQQAKKFIIDKLDHLEQFRTFVQTDNGYKVTTPEGYVLHQDGNMIKLVNRIEFAYNNFTIQKQWR
jgi:hypothetical protein|tara:strand:- start:133 stop:1338 length:1206 start_codon:yes stop_codon:yes gene_type:complete